ncbi:hypothetical protein SAMN05216259_103243 [Actinacidiphila guanduensis]|uniref:Uncharacterized protein n=1 Tax=Actinacidiphila guanduensis TaxID=310781 RepID=A0A1G9ZPM5_9ACTN|nr:hypothetical protein SAMN05216259_103243 [Actinacidiphila guanduensis]
MSRTRGLLRVSAVAGLILGASAAAGTVAAAYADDAPATSAQVAVSGQAGQAAGTDAVPATAAAAGNQVAAPDSWWP